MRCDGIAEEFKSLLKSLNAHPDDYIRTTEERHKKVVCHLLTDLYERGEIYQAEYKGFYSTRAEQFLQEKDKVDGKWPEIYGEVTEITEKNYFFKLGKYQDWLIEHIRTNPTFIAPDYRQNQVLNFSRNLLTIFAFHVPRSVCLGEFHFRLMPIL